MTAPHKRKAAGPGSDAAFQRKNGTNSSGFDRSRLPDPISYYESRGLVFRESRGAWRTTACEFHGGSDSMRIHVERGAFICMACNAHGGDLVAYQMAVAGQDFIAAAKALGAWVDGDDGHHRPSRPTPLPARDALALLAQETNLVAIEAARLGAGVSLTPADRERVLKAAGRIGYIAGTIG